MEHETLSEACTCLFEEVLQSKKWTKCGLRPTEGKGCSSNINYFYIIKCFLFCSVAASSVCLRQSLKSNFIVLVLLWCTASIRYVVFFFFPFLFSFSTFHDWDSALKVMLVILLIVEGWMMVRETIKRAEMPFIATVHESKSRKH